MENDPGQFNTDFTECIHHWLINALNFGVCKKCGVSKQFCSSWSTVQRSWYSGARKAQRDVPATKS